MDSNSTDCTVHLIESSDCNESQIESRMTAINKENFLFIAYCHGKEDGLTVNGCTYLESKKNTHLFVNSFFYAIACLTGKNLSYDLIDNGCHSFIGYREPFIFPTENFYLAVECGNYALKQFIKGHNVGDSFAAMKSYYNEKIDELVASDEIIRACFMTRNAESLVLLGRDDLTIQDFLC